MQAKKVGSLACTFVHGNRKAKHCEKIERWGNRHHPKLLDLVLIALGIFLIARGSIFLMRITYIRDMVTMFKKQ